MLRPGSIATLAAVEITERVCYGLKLGGERRRRRLGSTRTGAPNKIRELDGDPVNRPVMATSYCPGAQMSGPLEDCSRWFEAARRCGLASLFRNHCQNASPAG